MHIAIEGCCHGELDRIYETIAFIESKHAIKIDLLLCCGDFQAVRNAKDLESMSVPPKYKQMQTFHKYYSGERRAPVLTIFIGGNHEASDYLWEMPLGGWVAPNIFYIGRAGLVNFGGLRIGGVSGIYKSHDYYKGVFEAPPFDNQTMRSIYHIRDFEIFRCKLISKPIDIFLSHDWPRGVYHHGNVDELLRKKPYFQDDICSNSLGAAPLEEILARLKPSYWFCAHLHVKFAAIVNHADSQTRFLALDKCIPGKDFLQVLCFPDSDEPKELRYDSEWLAIVKATQSLLATDRWQPSLPSQGTDDFNKYQANEDSLKEIEEAFQDLRVPENFVATAPVFDQSAAVDSAPPSLAENPQTLELCRKIGIENFYKQSTEAVSFEGEAAPKGLEAPNPDEIDLDLEEEEEEPPLKQPKNDREHEETGSA
ncbi:lariat debranching enzyme-like [Oscarella lobularis]|uniref:lariat debranching enzyme-like n=1 Tax=Oscarella lobularis TaxID=121494 RepID=UPI003313E3DF